MVVRLCGPEVVEVVGFHFQRPEVLPMMALLVGAFQKFVGCPPYCSLPLLSTMALLSVPSFHCLPLVVELLED